MKDLPERLQHIHELNYMLHSAPGSGAAAILVELRGKGCHVHLGRPERTIGDEERATLKEAPPRRG